MDQRTIINEEILNIVRRYIAELGKNNIPIKTAFLFGSYANGKYEEWSDIDIALVSDKFEGDRFYDRRKIADVTLSLDVRIEPHTYRVEDFNEDEDLFVREILRTGIKIV
ncbi:MAG: nucleotidyltransferase domain-containing protein [Ignavibacteriae bacterium]|nr:MAG: nucleotidyltransferase domain-containing protein [Ignavibacteriota bacterium]